MRKLVLFTIGFAAACVMEVYVLRGSATLLPVFLCITAGLICLLIRNRAAIALFTAFLGGVLGFLWLDCYDALFFQKLRDLDGQTVQTQVEISDYSYETYYGIAADGRLNLEGKAYKVRLYVNDMEDLNPGDVIRGQIQFRATTDAGEAESDYYQGIGLFLVGYVQDGAMVERTEKLPVRYYPAALRRSILAILDRCFPADTLAFARALLLGDTRLLSYAQDSAFQISGIRHVVAVSGLHISILFSLVYVLAGKRRLMTALLGLPTLLVFAAVSGFTPSVMRACGMQMLMILALLLNKDYDSPTALAAAVLGMLLANPLSVRSVSLQLSVGCMVGIFLFCRKIHAWLSAGRLGSLAKGRNFVARMVRWCIGSVSVTLSAMSLTTPLTAYYFGTVSIIGIFTNLLTLWLISFIFYGIMLCCILGGVWLSAGQFIGAVVSVPMRIVQDVSAGLSRLPFAAVFTSSIYVLYWLVLCYILLAVFLLQQKKKPLRLALCMVLSLALAVGASCLEPVLGNYLVTVIDVGQGQCVLLRCADRHYLVDCGGESEEQTADTVSEMLLSQGIIALDGIIVTHFDADHVNAVAPLMSRIPTKALYLPDAPDSRGFKDELVENYADRITWITEDSQLTHGDWQITVFAGESGKEGNESCLCVLFQRQNCDILITGDRSTGGENALLEKWSIPDLELLVAGHHGAASSTGFRLLTATRPDVAAISVGKDNAYGHPTRQALERLEIFDCVVFRTDLHGHIHFRR